MSSISSCLVNFVPECHPLSVRCMWKSINEVANSTGACQGIVGACSNISFREYPRFCLNILDMCKHIFMADISFNKMCFHVFEVNKTKNYTPIDSITTYSLTLLLLGVVGLYLYIFSITYSDHLPGASDFISTRSLRRRLPRFRESAKQQQIDAVNQNIKDLGGDPMETPPEFDCPITFLVMTNPVILTSGQTFERQAILIHFHRWGFTCPLTREIVEPNILEPNESLIKEIDKWMERQQEYCDYLKSGEAETLVILPEEESNKQNDSSQTVFLDQRNVNNYRNATSLLHRV